MKETGGKLQSWTSPFPHFNDAINARLCSFAPSSLLWGGRVLIVPFYSVQDCSQVSQGGEANEWFQRRSVERERLFLASLVIGILRYWYLIDIHQNLTTDVLIWTRFLCLGINLAFIRQIFIGQLTCPSNMLWFRTYDWARYHNHLKSD